MEGWRVGTAEAERRGVGWQALGAPEVSRSAPPPHCALVRVPLGVPPARPADRGERPPAPRRRARKPLQTQKLN